MHVSLGRARNPQGRKRTEGIGMLLLKRLRTRLSIPLGLRHDSPTHLKRSDWWRQKRLVPVSRLVIYSVEHRLYDIVVIEFGDVWVVGKSF